MTSGFETREQIAADVATILNADLTHGTKWSVIDNAMWSWTEFSTASLLVARAGRRWRFFGMSNAVAKWGGRSTTPRAHCPALCSFQVSTRPPYANCSERVRPFTQLVIGFVVDRTEEAVLNQYRSSMPANSTILSFGLPKSVVRYERCASPSILTWLKRRIG